MRKKNVFYILWLLWMGGGALLAQSNYYDFQPKDKLPVYIDNFDTAATTKFWTGKDREHKGKIKYGQYLYKSVAIGLKPAYIAPHFDLDTDKDFEVEMLVSCNGNDYGLVWGQNQSLERFYKFHLLRKGFIVGNEQKIFIKGKVKNLIADWNKITLRKVDDLYYFFINEKLVYQMPFSPIQDVRMGIGTPGWKVFTDYFNIYYLNVNKP